MGGEVCVLNFPLLLAFKLLTPSALTPAAGSYAMQGAVDFCFCFHATTTAEPVH